MKDKRGSGHFGDVIARNITMWKAPKIKLISLMSLPRFARNDTE